ncbi:MAG: 30S ribosomal protein S6 [Phycisphaeraceae bacterium]
MVESNANLYEGLFLFNIQAINGSLTAAIEHVTEILNRANAEIVAISKWDERKLAYEIAGQKRGLYLLAHFKVRGTQLANIERDINLSELLIRGLLLRADHIGEIELQHVLAEAAKTRDTVALGGAPAGTAPAKAQAVETVPADADVDVVDDADENA